MAGNDCDVVIGAGAAGLAAARILADAGRSVLVLEARDRIGGRLFTDRSLCDLPIDLGGELIHGSRVVTWEIVRALSLPTRPMTTLLVQPDGTLAEFDDNDLGDIDPRALPVPYPGETRAAWLERAGVARSRWPPIFRFLDADGEPFDRVSALAPIAQLADDPNPDAYGGADFVLMGGYDEVLQPLRNGLDIRFGSVVTDVAWSEAGVEVMFQTGTGATERVTGDFAIATFPIGVLKAGTVRFEPGLPPARQRAIDALGVTSVVKLVYGLDHPVFPPGCDSLMDFANPIPLWWAWDGTTDRSRQDLEVVVGWAAGDVSRRLRTHARDHDEMLALGRDALRTLTGEPDLEPVFAVWHDWETDPFAFGAYSSVPPGAEDAYATLAAKDTGRLLWAGEATIPGQSKTVHGAISSGRRAANQVLHPYHRAS